MPEEKRRGRPKGSKDTKPRKERSDRGTLNSAQYLPNIENVKLPAGYNTNKIGFLRMIMPEDPINYDDVEEMKRRFYRYLDLCAEYDQKIGNKAAYMAMGLNDNQVWEFINRRQSNPERANFLKKVKEFCANYREGLMEDGKINPVVGIFWQKNYDGMKDQSEVVVTPNTNPLGEGVDPAALQQKYLENAESIAEISQKGAERPILDVSAYEVPAPVGDPSEPA